SLPSEQSSEQNQNTVGRAGARRPAFERVLFGFFGLAFAAGAIVLPRASLAAIAPTLVSYTQTSWDTTGYSSDAKATASISWQTNDVIVVVAGEENASHTIGTPSAGSLSFSSIAAYNPGNDANHSASAVFAATAGSNGSGAVTTLLSSAGQTPNAGFGVWVFRGSAGVGHSAEQ